MIKSNLNATISSHNHLMIARQREKEEKLYEQLHKSIYTLTLCYKTTADFKVYFTEGMFSKPNPNGCQHVMHFLLTIIDAAKFKKNVDWPVLDKKMESVFRTQMRTYLSKLALEYPNANIPPVQLSYLITPGGFKFCRMLLQIAQLAMVVHLQKKNTIHIMSQEPDDKEISHILDLMEKSKIRAQSQFNIRRLIFHRAAEQASLIIAENEKVVEERRLKELKYTEIVDKLSLLSPEDRQKFLDGSIFPVWESHIDSLRNEVEKLSKDIETIATICEETDHFSNILTSKNSRPCLVYNDNINDLKPLMRVVQGQNRVCVNNILCNGKLHLPNLLNSLSYVFMSIIPIMEHNKTTYGSKDCLNVLEQKVKEMEECYASYVQMDTEVNERVQEIQASIDKRLSSYELYEDRNSQVSLSELVESPSICLRSADTNLIDTHWLNYKFVKSRLNLKMLPPRENFRIRKAILSRTPQSFNNTNSCNKSLNYSSFGRTNYLLSSTSRMSKNYSINKSHKRSLFNEDLKQFLAGSVRKMKKNYSRIEETFENSIYKSQSSPCIKKICLSNHPSTPGKNIVDQDSTKIQTPRSFKLLTPITSSPLAAHLKYTPSNEESKNTPSIARHFSLNVKEEVKIMTTPVSKRTSTPNTRCNLDSKINFMLAPDMKDINISEKEVTATVVSASSFNASPQQTGDIKVKSRPSLELLINRFKNIKSLQTLTKRTCSPPLEIDDENIENIPDNSQNLETIFDIKVDTERSFNSNAKNLTNYVDNKRYSLTKLVPESDYDVNNLSMPLNVSLDSD